MSTDSTELTFVRCPSCRSLVPAVSTRCRMCGAGIDAQGKDAGSSESPRRTRSNTVTQPNTEFVNATEAVRAAENTKSVIAVEPNAPEESEFEDFDPLKDYLDDPSESAPAPEPIAPTRLEASPTSTKQVAEEDLDDEGTELPEEIDDDFDIFGSEEDENDDWLDDVKDEQVTSREPAERKAEPVAAPRTVEEPLAGKPAAKPEVPQHNRNNGGNRQEAKAPAKEQPKVVVESGGRSAGKPSGLSFGKGRTPEEPQQKRAAGEDARTEKRRDQKPPVTEQYSRPNPQGNERGQQDNRSQEPRLQDNRRRDSRENQDQRRDQPAQKSVQPHKNQLRHEQQRQDQPRNEQPRNEQPRQEQPRQEARQEPTRQEAPRQEYRREQSERGKAPVQDGVDSRLAGWLVSFSTPTRSALELREGKFFVSAASLKPHDVVLDHPSISTPHAMVTVEPGRVLVQDLMSETGVYHRRQGEQQFAEASALFELKHGDWIRFGEVDFLVTIIPAEHKR